MQFLEKDLEEILSTASQSAIVNRGLDCFDHEQLFRQFSLGDYGRMDLLGISHYKNRVDVTIYELKQNDVNTAALHQALGYMKALQKMEPFFGNLTVFYTIVLIGRCVDLKDNLCFLPEIARGVKIYTYDYQFDGIHFEQPKFYFTNKLVSNTAVDTIKGAFQWHRYAKLQPIDDLPF